MDDWQISKTLGQCCATGRKFDPGEEYFAALVESEDGLQRYDFSADYWQQNAPEVYCFWKTRLPDANEKRKIFIDDDMLLAFFDRLGSETDPQKINFRFVVTLILMRKRKLKYDSMKSRDGKEIWRLRIVGINEYAEVENPHLTEDQIEDLSSQLGQILQADL